MQQFSDAGNAVFPRVGSVIQTFQPHNERELAEILRQAAEEKTTVTITAALTGLTGSAVPLESGIRIDMSQMVFLEDRAGYHRVAPFLLISDANPLAGLVAPGVPLHVLNDALTALGLWYPPQPGETRAQIGGNVATNASGPRTFAFGPTRNYVESLRMVLMNGDVLRLQRGVHFASEKKFSVKSESGREFSGTLPDYELPKVKNAAGLFVQPGMDLIDLFIGSEGILGAFSQIGLRFLPLRKIRGEIFFLSMVGAALNLVKGLRRTPGVVSLEFFDKNSLQLAKNSGHKISASAEAAIEVEAFENDEAAWKEIFALAEKFAPVGSLSGPAVEHFRYAVPRGVAEWLKQHSVPKLGTDFAVPVESFEEMYRFYEKIEAEFGVDPEVVRTANWGHIGDGHLHFNFLCSNAEDLTRAKRLYLKLVREAVRLGGTVSAEHGVGKKTLADEEGVSYPYLFYMLGNKIFQIADIKKIFDPHLLLNRGNMIPNTSPIS